MKYQYAALLLDESGQEINEDNLTRVLEGAGLTPEQSRIKALVAALEGVDLTGDAHPHNPVAGDGDGTVHGASGGEPETTAIQGGGDELGGTE